MRSRGGFTLVEILVSMAIISSIAIAITTIFADFFSLQSRMESRSVGRDFSGSLAQNLMSQKGCGEALIGKTLAKGNALSDLKISKFGSFGAPIEKPAQGIGQSAPNEIGKGASIGGQTRIREFRMRQKPGMVPQRVSDAGANNFSHVVQIELITETQSNVSGTFDSQRPISLEIPVRTDQFDGGTIVDCDISRTPQQSCEEMGWQMPTGTNSCRPNETVNRCASAGTFSTQVTEVWFWIFSNTVQAFYLAGAYASPGVQNDYTKGESCPAGFTASPTGKSRRLINIVLHPNGKGAALIYAEDSYNLCLKCN